MFFAKICFCRFFREKNKEARRTTVIFRFSFFSQNRQLVHRWFNQSIEREKMTIIFCKAWKIAKWPSWKNLFYWWYTVYLPLPVILYDNGWFFQGLLLLFKLYHSLDVPLGGSKSSVDDMPYCLLFWCTIGQIWFRWNREENHDCVSKLTTKLVDRRMRVVSHEKFQTVSQ